MMEIVGTHGGQGARGRAGAKTVARADLEDRDPLVRALSAWRALSHLGASDIERARRPIVWRQVLAALDARTAGL